ncbi:MAG: type III restriction endonuclease subunit M [Bacteroidetes bacterium HGW-Bacteroidetes-4]|jgi:adenine-specific DNA-methyltransferase|nr:MAG: type III restriction endonuclease subunit M [Bacteroidetes bacterium HGW-Bacteroidetes-4]
MPTLNWIGKDKVINHHMDVPYKILDHVYGFDNGEQAPKETNSGNKIIHGDNLEALKALLPEYEGKIDCIYIDPPYNTGNEGWIYNDNVSDPKFKKWLGKVVGKEAEDLSRHDKWLCMMYPRLKLLHKLLSIDGAIFISIDDNEQANLRLVCDEVFGGRNFIDTIIWQKKQSPQSDATYFSDMHDYIIVYAKRTKAYKDDPNGFTLSKLARTEFQDNRYKNPDNDPRGAWTSSDYTCNKNAEERPNLYYPIVNPNTMEEIWPQKTSVWRYSKERHKENLKKNLITWGADGKGRPRFKRFKNEVGGVVPSTLWLREFAGDNQEARKEFRSIFSQHETDFTTPKPTKLIDKIINISTNKNSLILDSFAGSGTTAHAVLKLNKQDGGNRKFILIEMEDYAKNITAERVKRVIIGYGENGKNTEGTGGSFDYYQLGKPLFLENDMLNEEVSFEKIREYVWFSETRQSYKAVNQKEEHLLGVSNSSAYYFYYYKNELTTLDDSFLRKLKTKAEQYTIYADNCVLDDSLMQKYHITFKKIPRDITRF